MPIRFARLVLPDEDESDLTPSNMVRDKYVLKLCLRNKYSLLYAQSEEEYKNWIKAFT